MRSKGSRPDGIHTRPGVARPSTPCLGARDAHRPPSPSLQHAAWTRPRIDDFLGARRGGAARMSDGRKEPAEVRRIRAIRNLGIMGHSEAGKTTLTERLLFGA